MFVRAMCFAAISILLVAFAGCYKAPEIDKPSLGELPKLNLKQTCSKDNEKAITEEARAGAVVLRDEVEVQDREHVSCDGRVINLGHGPVRLVELDTDVAAPTGLKEIISMVEISNPRTCASIRVAAKDDQRIVPRATNHESLGTQVGTSGFVRLGISDTTIIHDHDVQLNVVGGLNLISIRYFGKCLELRKDVDESKPLIDRCARAEALATKEILIDLQVKRTEVPGVRRYESCPKQ